MCIRDCQSTLQYFYENCNVTDIFLGTLQSVQELQLNTSQSEPEINYITTKVNEPVPQSEMANFPDNSKKVSSPTQPKSLQQEFSLINMNIPNIEVIRKIILHKIKMMKRLT